MHGKFWLWGRPLKGVSASLPPDVKIVCLATAHPAKFPETVRQALAIKELPPAALHSANKLWTGDRL